MKKVREGQTWVPRAFALVAVIALVVVGTPLLRAPVMGSLARMGCRTHGAAHWSIYTV